MLENLLFLYQKDKKLKIISMKEEHHLIRAIKFLMHSMTGLLASG
jgi:hypothetical protein